MAVLFEAYLYPNGATIEVKNGESGDYEPIESNILPDPTTWFNSTGRQARFVYDRTFREWNSRWDGNGTSYAPGDVATNKASYYAIWEEPPERNYIATESELTSIANAIRLKGGTSVALTYPDGFVSAIEAISTGGGGDIDALIDKSIAEIESNVQTIGAYAFNGCSNLTTADFPLATSIGNYAFRYCSKLTTAYFPLVTSIGAYAFNGCSKLTIADYPLATSIENQAFSECTKFATLVLRSQTLCTLSNFGTFNLTPFGRSGTGGTLYVPNALISSYQSATGWSTILGYPNNQILPIEGSIYE